MKARRPRPQPIRAVLKKAGKNSIQAFARHMEKNAAGIICLIKTHDNKITNCVLGEWDDEQILAALDHLTTGVKKAVADKNDPGHIAMPRPMDAPEPPEA